MNEKGTKFVVLENVTAVDLLGPYAMFIEEGPDYVFIAKGDVLTSLGEEHVDMIQFEPVAGWRNCVWVPKNLVQEYVPQEEK